jgi:autotransporter-associated beta strand protein
LFFATGSLLGATYTVTNTNDSGAGSLRQAILDANAGGAGGIIQFTIGGTITLITSLPPIQSTVSTIDTNGNSVTVNGNTANQPFFIQPGATTLTIKDKLVVSQGASIGGNGGGMNGNGGGGGLGAGGGIFVGTGTSVTLTGVSFANCQAVGGNGGAQTASGIGGGGGGGMNSGSGGNSTGGAGGGGGGYGGAGGLGDAGGGGGGGLFFQGGSGASASFAGGGGGGSDANAGGAASGSSTAGGNGGADLVGNPGGTGGSLGSDGGNGTGNSGGGGGGGNTTGNGGAGGSSAMGAGGGGGGTTHGGAAGNSTGSLGGGGGGGNGMIGGVGGKGGAFAGGGGAGTMMSGGAGGFGGGGGGAGTSGIGGMSGFGAGSGGGNTSGLAGYAGGYGGNGGPSGNGGGGGAGLGGAIFVQNGGTLIINDPFTPPLFSSNTTLGGTGGTAFSTGGAGTAGQQFGPDIFLMSGGSITFSNGTTLSIASNINSDIGIGGGTGGGLTMNGSGTLTLGGLNSYTGTTSLNSGNVTISRDANLGFFNTPLAFNGGTLEVTSTLGSSRSISFTGAANVIVDNAAVATFSGAVSGSGALTVSGMGTFALSGTNSFTSSITINNPGNLQFNAPQSYPSASNILDNGNLIFGNFSGTTLTASGAISGTGGLTVQGGGTVILSGNNTYGGTTTISFGVLQIDGVSSLAGSNVVDNGTLAFNNTATMTVSQNISGLGGLTVQNTGTVILTGTNTYSGTTTISSGTLQINNALSVPATGGIIDNSSLVFNQSGLATVAGSISGSGTVTMNGSGTLIFAGNNTYLGTTTIAAGTLQINSNTGLPPGGNVIDKTALVFNNSDIATVSGNISDVGTLTTQGTGTVILSGNNTYGGITTIQSGSTLQINAANSLPTNNVVDNGILNFNIPGTFTFPGLITGSGFVNQISSGTLILSNAGNNFTGGTTISNGGTATFTPNNFFGAATSTLTLNNGTLDVPLGTASFSSQHPIVLQGPGTLDVEDAATTVTMLGNISGAGSFTLTGLGNVVFSGNSTYTGTTTISNNSLQINNATSFPLNSNVVNSGAFIFNNSGTASVGGQISGAGNLTMQGSGILSLSGFNTYSGATTILSGTLQINAFNSLSTSTAVTNSSLLSFTNTGLATVPSLISGTGSVAINSSGKVALTNNANSYQGGTSVLNNGTLQITNDGALGMAGTSVTLNRGTFDVPTGTLALTTARPFVLAGPGIFSVDDPSGVLTLQGNITGPGSFAKQGVGTLVLQGVNTYLGTTTINQGILQINTTGSLPSANNIYDNGSLVFGHTGVLTLSGIVSGTGSITLNTNGTLALTNTGNSLSGGFNISNVGTLQITSGFQVGNSTISLNNATLDIPSGSSQVIVTTPLALAGSGTVSVDGAAGLATLQGAISGPGALTKQGSGTLVLSGSNVYGGATTISAGTLQIASQGSLPAASDVTDNGSLVFNTASTIAVPNNIGGSGSLTAQGGGIVQLSGTNSYGGATIISFGTLQINTATSLPPASPITDNGTLAFNIPGSFLFSGNVSGSGGLTQLSSGVLSLNGVNTYLGTTTISSGTLQINAATSLPSTSSIVDNGNLNFNHSGTLTLGGVVSGTGGVNLISGATLVLANTSNSYSGGTGISNNGIIQITNSGQLGNIYASLSLNSGTLDFPVGTTSVLLKAPIQLAGPGIVSVDDPLGVITLQGTISGPGGLTKQGPGTVILTGINNYGGVTTISAGTLQINAFSALPTASGVIDNGLLVFNHAGFANFSGNVSGSGGLTMQGAGTLILSGTNTYLGSTAISSGTLQIANAASLPPGTNVVDNGALNFAIPGSFTLNGLISGTGSVSQISNGTLILSNASNSYLGGTAVTSNGTIQWTNDGQLGAPLGLLTFNNGTVDVPVGTLSLMSSRPIRLLGPGVVSVDDPAGVVTLKGNIYGTGTLTAAGPGKLILAGHNTFLGPLVITTGSTVEVDSSDGIGASTNITDNGALIFNHTGIATLGGTISGNGGLTMEGAGTLVLTGVNTYLGPTAVTAGILKINGSLASTVTVSPPGVLEGTGTGNLIVIQGTVAPGNSIGTLHAASVTLTSSSTYNLEFNNTTSDLIAATNSVTIDGGKLVLIPEGFTGAGAASYTIITAPLVTTNAPFTIVNPLTRFQFFAQYTPTEVLLVSGGTPIPFNQLVTAGNAGSVASCFDQLSSANPPDLSDVLAILNLQTPGQMAHSFGQMQPANFDNLAFGEENAIETIRKVYSEHFLFYHLHALKKEMEPQKGQVKGWVAPFFEKDRGRGHERGYRQHFAGFTAAVDYKFPKHFLILGGFSYAKADLGIDNHREKGSFQTFAGALGAVWTNGGFFAEGLFSYFYTPADGRRKMNFKVSIPQFSSSVHRGAKHSSQTRGVMQHVGGGYDFKIYKRRHNLLTLRPFVNIDYTYLMQMGYKEQGAGSLDLRVHHKQYDCLRPEGGVGASYRTLWRTWNIIANAAASYAVELRYLGKHTKAHFKSESCQFKVVGPHPTNHLICPAASFGVGTKDNRFTLTAGYFGEFGSKLISNAAEIELGARF